MSMQLVIDSPPQAPRKRRHRAVKPQLLTRDQLDKRSNAFKVFDQMVSAIEVDLGGRDNLVTMEKALVEGFAGAYALVANINTRLAKGEDIDFAQHAQCVSEMVRVARLLGLERRAKTVGDTYGEALRKDAERQRLHNNGAARAKSNDEAVDD